MARPASPFFLVAARPDVLMTDRVLTYRDLGMLGGVVLAEGVVGVKQGPIEGPLGTGFSTTGIRAYSRVRAPVVVKSVGWKLTKVIEERAFFLVVKVAAGSAFAEEIQRGYRLLRDGAKVEVPSIRQLVEAGVQASDGQRTRFRREGLVLDRQVGDKASHTVPLDVFKGSNLALIKLALGHTGSEGRVVGTGVGIRQQTVVGVEEQVGGEVANSRGLPAAELVLTVVVLGARAKSSRVLVASGTAGDDLVDVDDVVLQDSVVEGTRSQYMALVFLLSGQTKRVSSGASEGLVSRGSGTADRTKGRRCVGEGGPTRGDGSGAWGRGVRRGGGRGHGLSGNRGRGGHNRCGGLRHIVGVVVRGRGWGVGGIADEIFLFIVTANIKFFSTRVSNFSKDVIDGREHGYSSGVGGW